MWECEPKNYLKDSIENFALFAGHLKTDNALPNKHKQLRVLKSEPKARNGPVIIGTDRQEREKFIFYWGY